MLKGRTVHLVLSASLAFFAAACGRTVSTNTQSTTESPCRVDGAVATLAGLPEASGVAVSRRASDRFWTHNDSGQPALFMFDEDGTVTARVHLPDATVIDWEAVAAGPCGSESCLYVADIGDNDARRDQITIYRVTEPLDANAATATAEALHGKYPDGPHDAETLLVSGAGDVYIVTKGSTGPIALYRFPRDAGAGGPAVQLERVGEPRSARRVSNDEQVTDGAVSADGTRIVLRTHDALFFYRTPQLLAGDWREEAWADLKHIGEPQGEGVAFGPGNAVYLTSEGGDESDAGTFVRLRCAG
jgi:hypothetical protein